ncbi:MAG: SsrA-binding protein SmpB [Nitrospirota bacterium]
MTPRYSNDGSQGKPLVTNRKAFHDYFIEERYEAGISLRGTEVKALREGQATLQDSFARIEDGQVILHHCHISPYSHGAGADHEPLRPRTLLLHREEIKRLMGKVQQKGYTLVPLQLYLKKGRVKVELGLAKGKQRGDKRETLRRKTAEREMEKAMKRERRGER